MSTENTQQGCDYCNHPQYAGLKCPECGRVTEQPADDNDFPRGKACDLSDDGTCEACQ